MPILHAIGLIGSSSIVPLVESLHKFAVPKNLPGFDLVGYKWRCSSVFNLVFYFLNSPCILFSANFVRLYVSLVNCSVWSICTNFSVHFKLYWNPQLQHHGPLSCFIIKIFGFFSEPVNNRFIFVKNMNFTIMLACTS